MKVAEAIKKRRSVRRFKSQRAVDPEKLEKLLEAAGWAPSAGNLQSWFCIVVKDPAVKKQLARQEFVAQAPVVFVFCADLKRCRGRYGLRGAELYAIQDATLAAYNLWLQAVELGMAACWVGAFDESQVIDALGLAADLKPVVLLPVGYPAESPVTPEHRRVKELFSKI